MYGLVTREFIITYVYAYVTQLVNHVQAYRMEYTQHLTFIVPLLTCFLLLVFSSHPLYYVRVHLIVHFKDREKGEEYKERGVLQSRVVGKG